MREELENCTFKPKINKYSSQIQRGKIESRLIFWKEKKEKKMENLRKSFLEEQEKSIEHSRVKKNKKVKTDLRFMSSKSV